MLVKVLKNKFMSHVCRNFCHLNEDEKVNQIMLMKSYLTNRRKNINSFKNVLNLVVSCKQYIKILK